MTAAGSGGGLPPVCVLAGGRATRLGKIAATIPKALVPVAGEPFIFHQLRLLATSGARKVVLSVGHLGAQIEDAVGDGAEFGLDVSYAHDPPVLAGTAGAVRGALELLGSPFLVTYGDAYLRLDYAGFAAAFKRSPLPAQMSVYRNSNRWDRSNAHVEADFVVGYDRSNPSPDWEWIDYGVGAFEADVFRAGPGARLADLAGVYRALVRERKVGAYIAQRRFYEIGTAAGLRATEEFLRGEGASQSGASRG